MVLRATLVVLCIVLGLALFSDGPGQENGWLLAGGVGLLVAGIALGVEYTLREAKPGVLLGGAAGLTAGLLLAGIASWAVAVTVPAFESVPVLGFLFLATFPYLGLIFGMKIFTAAGILGQPDIAVGDARVSVSNKILDTSVIIDGRVADLCETGFLEGTFILPQFILNELQHIADSSDPLRRNRGRRGLDMLNKLQKESVVPIVITDLDVEEVREVDDKLVMLAKKLHSPIITNDFNLNRVAELQGVVVLNVNELTNAVRVILLPGESLQVRIIQEGKEAGQGVGYLDDGTMVVVENGKRHLNHTIDATVTKVLQTAAGRMIFAQPASN